MLYVFDCCGTKDEKTKALHLQGGEHHRCQDLLLRAENCCAQWAHRCSGGLILGLLSHLVVSQWLHKGLTNYFLKL